MILTQINIFVGLVLLSCALAKPATKDKKVIDKKNICESDEECDPETECCGVTFGVRMCKLRPGPGDICDPYADSSCNENFCECPCKEGYQCQKAMVSSNLYICQRDDEGENKENVMPIAAKEKKAPAPVKDE